MDNNDETRQLVTGITAGKIDDFHKIIEQYQKLVGHIVFKIVTNESDREDLCQVIFIKVYQNLSSFKFESKLSTWIARIAYNTSLNYLEKKNVPLYDDLNPDGNFVNNLPDRGIKPDEQTIQINIKIKLQEEIMKLPITYRTVLTLYHLEEMSYKEISEITGLPDGTVKSHLFRARKLLKDRLLTKYQMEDLCR